MSESGQERLNLNVRGWSAMPPILPVIADIPSRLGRSSGPEDFHPRALRSWSNSTARANSSRATSPVTSRAQPSAVLKATTRRGCRYWPDKRSATTVVRSASAGSVSRLARPSWPKSRCRHGSAPAAGLLSCAWHSRPLARRGGRGPLAFRRQLLVLRDACSRYTLTVDEFLSWQSSIDQYGVAGLRTTRIQQYRQK
jgi:hypothetical protein